MRQFHRIPSFSRPQEVKQRLDMIANEHKQYDDAREASKAWIEKTTQRLLQCSDTSGDQAALKEKLKGVQVGSLANLCLLPVPLRERPPALQRIINALEEGEALVTAANEAGERVAKRAGPQGVAKVEHELEPIRADWAELTRQLTACNATLDNAVARWSDYADLIGRICRWLDEAEATSDAVVPVKNDLIEKKSQLDRFKVGCDFCRALLL